MKQKLTTLAIATAAALTLTAPAQAGEGRYQAHWNGKNYLILDTDKGHIWQYFGDTIMYTGQIDGDDFSAPDKTKIWNQKHGKWEQN